MATCHIQLRDWMPLIRAEFDELPGLQLTQAQVEELWGLKADAAAAILDALVAAGFLTRTGQGTYVRVGAD
jgi:hypothetical protein